MKIIDIMKKDKNIEYKEYIFMNIIIHLTVIAILIPVIVLCVWGFVNRWPFPEIIPNAWSLRGIKKLFFGYMNIRKILISSIFISITVSIITTFVTTLACRSIVKYKSKIKFLIEMLVLLPIIVSPTVYGMGLHMVFAKIGLNNSLFSVICSNVMYCLPFSMGIIITSMNRKTIELEEQAFMLGTSETKSFIYITLPIIMPSIISSISVSFLMSYTQYFLTMLMSGGKIKTMAIILLPLIEGSDRTISSIYSILFILSSLIIFGIFQIISRICLKKIGEI